jgi:hypothetical protein
MSPSSISRHGSRVTSPAAARWSAGPATAGSPAGIASSRRTRARHEELLSLVFFYECNSDTRIESLGPPIGQVVYEPVLACDYLLDKLTVITVG